MAERAMSLTARRICECLHQNPGIVLADVAKAIGAKAEGIKKTVWRLIASGHVIQGVRHAKGIPLSLTGKPFPPSSAWTPTDQQSERLRVEAIDAAFAVVIPAMRAMVDAGRAAA